MSQPSLNRVSVIKCSQIRKRCRNLSIIGVSSLVHDFSKFFILRPIYKKKFHATLRPVTRGENLVLPFCTNVLDIIYNYWI